MKWKSVGGLVAFPTETVYGLGGDALDESAAEGCGVSGNTGGIKD